MKQIKKGIQFLIILVFFLNGYTIYSQRDSISQSNISTHQKSLQFGNEFLYNNEINISKNIPITIANTEYSKQYNFTYLTYNPERDGKRLLYNTGLYFGATLASFTILWFSPESFSNWDKDKIKEEGFFKQWKENVKAGPVWDEDNWVLNWVIHPWAGAVYYMSARGSGFKMWESFTYSVLMSSLFWEYGVEAFAEIPSWQDLILTPTVGSVIGELFFISKGKIINNNRRIWNSKLIGNTSLFIMDPFNEIIDLIGYKTKNKIETYSMIAPIDYDYVNNKSIWGMQVVVQF